MHADTSDLEEMDYEKLTDLINRAEALRAEQAKKMRAEIDERARLLGLEVHENGKAPRRKRTPAAQDSEV